MREFRALLDKYNSTKHTFRRENLSNGDLYNERQRRAEELLEIMTGYKTIPANRHGPSCLDGFLESEGEFKAGYEVKTRSDSFVKLESYGSFILTKKKVDNCVSVCSLLKIPFIAICYSVPDDAIKCWFVSDDRGRFPGVFNQSTKFLNKIWEDVYHFPFNSTIEL